MSEISFEAYEHKQLALTARSLMAERDRYKQALEKIAKPALGGKQQQWIAKAALDELRK